MSFAFPGAVPETVLAGLKKSSPLTLTGLPGGSKAFFVAALSAERKSSLVLVTSEDLEAEGLSADLEARLRKNPDDAEAHVALGDICQSFGKTDRAREEYLKVVALQPGNAKAYYNLGIACMARGDFRNAHEAFRKTLEIDPKQTRACHGMGIACKELGDYDGARREFEEALRLDPAFAPSCFSLGHLYQSVLGDRGKAAMYWEKYLELRPNDPQGSRIREWIEQERQQGAKESPSH